MEGHLVDGLLLGHPAGRKISEQPVKTHCSMNMSPNAGDLLEMMGRV